MSLLLPALFVAAALALAPPRPGARVAPSSRPRDGPGAASPPSQVTHHRMAADLDLFAACVRAGLTVPAAAAAVADASGHAPTGGADAWRTVAALSALGADAERSWGAMRALPGGEELLNLVVLSHTSGTAVAAGCERIAARLRDDASDLATAKAERAGVLIALPLTAFFLPAFFVLGLAPVVIGLAGKLT
ncbi:type II secretion system F family protein [Corynebacterium timonense]|uniref:Type II secretion system (T2SS), protein F n=1 Tax=Corynebacterium timonense TaxID=441500 RepID=A0A1H1TJY3_9CORY|nr:type II secretion system F family protein [Corynebacterium timonense]SDS60286.1 Type II secretion system (T2SS), protein F [Corynebacterium timonense]